jgi:hypothetical protein
LTVPISSTAVLFGFLVSAQASLVVLSPILSRVASDLQAVGDRYKWCESDISSLLPI